MPIGGVVITVVPADRQKTEMLLDRLEGLQIYGNDEKGNIIATLQATDAQSVREKIRRIEQIETVQKVNLAYLKEEETAGSSAVEGENGRG